MVPTIDGPDDGDEAEESRGTSPVRVPQEGDEDVFDGYSFKGRHSVIMDEDEEYKEEIEEDVVNEGQVAEEGSLAAAPEPELEEPVVTEEEEKEKQPETISTPAPDQALNVVRETEEASTPTQPSGTPTPEAPTPDTPATPAPVKVEPLLPEIPPPVPLKGAFRSSEQPRSAKAVTIIPAQPSRRREKSGVHALDRLRGQDTDMDESAAERDDDDDDWDFVETPGGEDRNGAKGTSLFARGVVDRYRLAVFRKASSSHTTNGSRIVSNASSVVGDDLGGGSPESRRGRLAKSTRSFLRARSPAARSASSQQSNSITASLSPGTSTVGSLTAHTASTTPMQTPHSLRSTESTTSMGSPSGSASSDGSVSRERLASATASEKRQQSEEHPADPPRRLKKMKRYKEGAEKVLSLFGSPRQERAQAQS